MFRAVYDPVSAKVPTTELATYYRTEEQKQEIARVTEEMRRKGTLGKLSMMNDLTYLAQDPPELRDIRTTIEALHDNITFSREQGIALPGPLDITDFAGDIAAAFRLHH
jgi:hypothetical protein